MKFFQKIKDSIYSPEFYKKAIKEPWKKALEYYLLFALLLTVIQTIIYAPFFISTQQKIPKMIMTLLSYFPNTLEVTIKNGEASTNAVEPVFIPENGRSNEILQDKSHFLVVDTTASFSAQQYDEYDTIFWLTKDTLIYKSGSNGRIQGYALTEINDFKITKDSIDQIYNGLRGWLSFIGVGLALFTFLVTYVLFLVKFVYLFFLALLIWGLSRILVWNISYFQSYKIGLYAITLPFILQILMESVRSWTHFNGFPFMTTIFSLAVVFLNLREMKSEHTKTETTS